MKHIDPQLLVDSAAGIFPTIYGDDEHDDTQGVAACLRNERFQYNGCVYAPGDDATICGCTLRFEPQTLLNFTGDDCDAAEYGLPPETVVICANGGRATSWVDLTFNFISKSQVVLKPSDTFTVGG